jgi:quercetin dioxygenase-like cupin family protein
MEKRMKQIVLTCVFVLSLSSASWCADANGIVSEVVAKGTTSWDGSVLPGYENGTPEVTILRITIPPGAVLPPHQHPVINAGVLVSGQLTVVTAEGKVLHMKANDGLIEVVNKWHSGKNEGDTPAQIIVFYAGAADTPLSIAK